MVSHIFFCDHSTCLPLTNDYQVRDSYGDVLISGNDEALILTCSIVIGILNDQLSVVVEGVWRQRASVDTAPINNLAHISRGHGALEYCALVQGNLVGGDSGMMVRIGIRMRMGTCWMWNEWWPGTVIDLIVISRMTCGNIKN